MIQNDMVETMMYITQRKDFEQLIKNGYIDNFMKSTLQCLTLFAENQRVFVAPQAGGVTNPVTYMFMNRGAEIFIKVILPIMKLTSEEKLLVIEHPMELINMSLDLVEGCESQTMKTCAVDLFHSFEKEIDGLASFILEFCLKFVSQAVSQDQESKQFIQDIIAKFDLNLTCEEDIIEVNLMILSLMKQTIVQRFESQIRIDEVMLTILPIVFDFQKEQQPQ
jgi:hypothetical protein